MISTANLTKLFNALRKAQTEFDPVLKDTKNPLYNSKYATLAGVIETTQPTLAENELVILQLAISDIDKKASGVTTILAHASGEHIESTLMLPAEMPGKDKTIRYDAQTACSAITFARRNAYLAIIGIAPEDDDGNAAVGREPARPSPTSKPGPVKTPNPTQAVKPAPAKASTATQATPSAINQPTTSVSSADAVSTTAATAQAPAEAKTVSGDLPTESDLAEYSKKVLELGEQLHERGGLKKSANAPIQRKILVFLSSIAEVKDIKLITRAQWENFFARVDAAKTRENGWVKLAEWVDKANGITKDTK